VRKRKAPPAAAQKARARRRVDLPGSEIGAEAIPSDFVMQAAAVHIGRDHIGFVLARGAAGIEAFTIDERSIGVFPDLTMAANAVVQAAGGDHD
jgi:hypothetical protein